MRVNELIREEDILMNLDCQSKEEVIMQLVDNLAVHHHLSSKEQCYKDIQLREEQISTGLVKGIAIPHTQSESVMDCKISIAKLVHGIPWKTLDDSLVQIVILITVPLNSQGEHLKILACIAEKLMDEATCDALYQAENENMIIHILEE